MTVPFVVRARAYERQDVHLDEELSELLRRPDPRKTEEAQDLRQLLQEFDPDALFQTTRFALPVQEIRRSSEFGRIRSYVFADGTSSVAVHSGMDYALPVGSPVSSSGKGRVVFAGERIISGTTVVIEHLPGVFSLYYHLSESRVEEGQTVEAGQLIGRVGNSGLATGPHLHWEVRVGGIAVDPEAMVTVVDMTPLSIGIMDEIVADRAERR